jgi:hypothetical protein
MDEAEKHEKLSACVREFFEDYLGKDEMNEEEKKVSPVVIQCNTKQMTDSMNVLLDKMAMLSGAGIAVNYMWTTGKKMIDLKKLQYYTMAHRLRGFAEGLKEGAGSCEDDDALIGMLDKAASLLEHAWDEYQSTLPPDQRVGS